MCVFTESITLKSIVGRYSLCQLPQTIKETKTKRNNGFFFQRDLLAAILHIELYYKNTTQC